MDLKHTLTLPFGMLLLAIAFLMGKFLPSNSYLDFIEGFICGLSVVLNIYYIRGIIHKSRKKI